MVAVSYLAMSSQYWSFGYGYFLSGRFTAIYDLLVLVLAFVLGLMVSQMGCRCKKMDGFHGEFGRNSLDLVNGFCSKSDRSCWCGCCKYVKDSKMSVENSKTTEESRGLERGDWDRQQTEGNVLMDCRNGNCGDTLLSAKKRAELGSGFCTGKDVFGVCCSKILFCAIGFWRSIKNQIFLSVENLNDDAKIDAGREKSGCQPKEEGLKNFRNRIDSSTFKAREEEEEEEVEEEAEAEGGGGGGEEEEEEEVEEEEAEAEAEAEGGGGEEEEEEQEEVFEECEAGDVVELEQEHQNVAYLESQKNRAATAFADDDMDYRKETYMGTFAMRKLMKNEEEDNDDTDNDGEEEYKGEEIEDYEEEDVTGLKNAYRIERECLNAAYLELEEERKAAASAANEVMAMIQRLQSEKNLIEMDARQFRYMAEYNQLYDQQVIQSLLWIISKLELERSVLQNQLKRCRKRLLQGGLFDEMVGEAEENQDDETVSGLAAQKSVEVNLAKPVDYNLNSHPVIKLN